MMAQRAPYLDSNVNFSVFGEEREHHVSLKVNDRQSFFNSKGPFDFEVP